MIQEKAESVPVTPFAFSCPQEVIDDFLRFGSNTTKSREHIIAALYPWHTPETDWLTEKARETFVNILRREYHGGYGLIVDGEKYAAWYDDQGLRVCRGTSARYSPFAQTIPWDDVLERVWHLYGDGAFATNVEAVEAHGNECREVALSLQYLYYDRTAQCRGKYLTSLDPYVGGGYPEEQARLAEALADKDKAYAIKEDLDAFMEAYDADRSLLRWPYHNLPKIKSRFASLLVSWDSVVPQAAAELTHNPFITEDELDAAISSGSNYEGGKKRIYDYFTANPSHTQKDKADFLKDEFGTGGHSHALSGADSSMEDYDAKGLRFRKGDCPEVTISWPNAAKRIDTLIRMNRYLTPEEQAREAEIRDAHYEEPEESEILPGDDSDAPGDESFDVAVETPKHEAVIIGEEDHTLYLYAPNGLSGELDLNGRKRQPEEALVVAAPAAYMSSDIMFAKDVTFLKIGRDISAEDLTGTKEDQLAAMKKAAASIHSEPWEAYTQAKQDFQDGIVLLRVGDDYEILGEDAEKAADALGLSLSSRYTPDGRVPMCRFSMSDLYGNVRKLNEKWNVRAVDYKDENHEQRISEDYPSFFNLLLQGKKTGRTRVERNYKAFARLFPEIVDGTYRYLQLRAPEETGYMPLTIEKIGENEYSVSHFYESNGDLMYDPEMTFRIDTKQGTLEPLTFRQDGSLALYQEVYPEPGKWIPKLRNELSAFTEQWLKNIEAQGRVRYRAIAERDGEDVEFSFDDAGKPVPAQPSDADPRPMRHQKADTSPRHDTSPAPETSSREMTQEEIDDALRAWNGRIESKQAVVRYMKEHGRDRETAAWLAREFGIAPDAPLVLVNSDASAETSMPWSKVQRRLMQLIRSEQFFTEEEYDKTTPSLSAPRWPVDVGDTVYLEDGKAFLVEHLSDREIRLRDPSLVYPISRAESFESFQRLLERFPQPGITDNAPVSADVADISYTPVVVSSDGPSEVVAIQTIRHSEPKEPIRVLPENYRITDDHLGEGGPKAKFRANMEAISTLKRIEAEGRNATPEEQEVLARYVGWGGLADAFDAGKADWSKEYSALKDALTPEEYAAARASTLNAHYTSPTVIRAIYEALSNMGFTSGNILEPACGVGNFFGMLPQEMSASKLYGVELDSVSGRIAKQLYPNANITVAGFETTDRRDFYDVAIGNVPFGQYQVNDRAYNKLGFSIHNYFFAKALDQVRAGGIVAFITSRYTMDAKDSTVRRYLAQRAELLGAIRLPNNAFKANAGTEVVSDILFLQKRDRPSLEEPDWLFTAKNIHDSALGKVGDVITFTTGYPQKEYTAEITEVGSGYANVPYYRGKNSDREFNYIAPSSVIGIERKTDFVYEINQYFLQHPEMVLGNPTSESTQYGRQDYTVAPADGLSLADQLRTAVGRIRASYYPLEFPDVADEATPVETIPADPTVRNFTYTLLDGVLWFRENSVMRKQTGLPATTEARIKGMVELRECMRALLDLELDDDVTDTEIQEKQAELSMLYDAFSASFGSINDRKNEAAFSEDSSYFLLCSLEEPEKDGKTYRKATDIFTKRTIKQRRTIDHVDTAAEALAVSIGQRAAVDLPFMAQLMGDHEKIAQIVDDLHGVIFKSPDTGPFDYAEGGEHWDKGWQTADEYLSGNVRKKLLQAETAAKSDPFFEINVEALTRAQPKELEATDIDVRLGSTWIAPEIFEQFMIETFQTPKYLQDSMRVRFSPYSGEWFIDHKTYIGHGDMIATSTYGTSRANAYEILEDCLNLRDVRIYDKDKNDRRILNGEETELAAQKQQAIRDAFQDWIWKDPKRREKLVRQYNEEMNSTRPREYDGKHLVFSGINPEIALREHQLNAIAHVIYGGNTLLAHEVGAGKSATRS